MELYIVDVNLEIVAWYDIFKLFDSNACKRYCKLYVFEIEMVVQTFGDLADTKTNVG